MRSIKESTIYISAISVSFVMIVFSLFGYFTFKNELEMQFNNDLKNEFNSLASVARVFPNGEFFVDLDFDMATQYSLGGSRLFQVWDKSNVEILDQAPAIESSGEYISYPLKIDDKSNYFYDFKLKNGRSLRGLIKTIDAQLVQESPEIKELNDRNLEIKLLVARDLEPLENTLTRITIYSLILLFFGLTAVSIAIVYSINNGLKPLDALVSDVEKIELSCHKLKLEKRPEELNSISNVINLLIERLDSIVKREQRYNSNIAHELRTPISEIRLATDVALRSSLSSDANVILKPERLLFATKQAHDISISMSNLVNTMLSLVRLESGQLKPNYSEFKINKLLDNILSTLKSKISLRGISVFSNYYPGSVVSDFTLFETILSNIVNNAVEYSSPDSVIDIHISVNDSIYLFVSNYVDNFDESELENIFLPFWKSDKSRNNRDHYGLGLAITHEAVHALKGRIDVKYLHGKIIFSVIIPLEKFNNN
ncbi:HAMP domain-containing histidine kinase [Vibrio fluvialis]|nr:HAMP domain-containing histidine kinase [Vibrio fluvialis]